MSLEADKFAKAFQDLFCEWCPNDCRDRKKDPLTDEERAGCVASGGFANVIVEELGDKLMVLTDGQWDMSEGWMLAVRDHGGKRVARLSSPDGSSAVEKYLEASRKGCVACGRPWKAG